MECGSLLPLLFIASLLAMRVAAGLIQFENERAGSKLPAVKSGSLLPLLFIASLLAMPAAAGLIQFENERAGSKLPAVKSGSKLPHSKWFGLSWLGRSNKDVNRQQKSPSRLAFPKSTRS